jgi:hypothetical protein
MSATGPEKVGSPSNSHRRGRFRTQLERLIAEKGLLPKSYGLFFTSGEDYTPGSKIENASGFLVTPKGEHFSFWKTNRTTKNASLTSWKQVEPEANWFNSNEYIEALYGAKVPAKLSPSISHDQVLELRRQSQTRQSAE